ncbi:MAG: hypothetical protein QXY40_11565 [Candidatus Methanomethylicia archaeon]
MSKSLIVRISVNDQFGLYDENCRRVDQILKALGLKPMTNWKQGKDLELGILSGATAIVKMREYESTVAPEILKLILLGIQYIDLRDYYTEIPLVERPFTEQLIKVADIDVWVSSKSLFKLLTYWNKVSKEQVCKKLHLKPDELISVGLEKYREHLNTLSPEIKEEIKHIEVEIIKKRLKM